VTKGMTNAVTYPSTQQLEAGLDTIRRSPANDGRLEMIVRRPSTDVREVVESAELDLSEGVVGDSWGRRRSSRTPDGSPHPEMQLNVMNTRVIALVAQDRERWPLAGDQLFVDFDLSAANLPPGTRLAIGSAEIEVTTQPHTGCSKFARRFGPDALKFVNSPEGKALHLRGINARVVRAGTIRAGDLVRKVPAAPTV
jgi:hypothetical protein